MHFETVQPLATTLTKCTSIVETVQIALTGPTSGQLFSNVNFFMRKLTGGLLTPFISDCRGPLAWIYLLQAAIEFRAGERPHPEVVYHGCTDENTDLAGLYCSAIGEVVVWPAFARTFKDRTCAMHDCANHPKVILFEIVLGHTAIAAEINNEEVLIAANSAFRVNDHCEEEIGDCILNVVKIEWIDDWSNALLEQNVHAMLME
jgi:hypothetical protein